MSESIKPSVQPDLGALFRDGMSRIAATVHLITTDGPAGRAGLTATAVTSLSADPPMLLVCIKIGGNSAPVLLENGIFAVNALAGDQANLADIFAGRGGIKGAARFSTGTWDTLATGAPVLSDAPVIFDCRLVEVHDIATHHIIVGRVEAIHFGPPRPGLLYLDRAYRAV